MPKTYSMWIEKKDNGKYKYVQRYIDPLQSVPGKIVTRKVTVTLTKKTPQAKREASLILAEKIKEKIQQQSIGSDISLKELTDKYQDHLKSTNRPWNTRKRALSNFKFINMYFDGAIAKNVTTAMINNYLEYLLYNRQPTLSNSSVRLRKVFLSNAYEYGIIHGLVNINPTKGVRVVWKNEAQKKKHKIENKFLTDTELRAVLGYVRYIANRLDYYHLLKWMSLTGMRISEATGLRPDSIFQKGGVYYARVNGISEYHYGELHEENEDHTQRANHVKTAAGYRDVYLNKSAVEVYKRSKELYGNSQFLFINTYSGNPWNSYTVDSYLKEIARKLGIAKNLSSHFFRHTYISKLVEKGVQLNVIMSQVGQADSEITKQIYTHVTDQEKIKLQNSLELLDNDIKI